MDRIHVALLGVNGELEVLKVLLTMEVFCVTTVILILAMTSRTDIHIRRVTNQNCPNPSNVGTSVIIKMEITPTICMTDGLVKTEKSPFRSRILPNALLSHESCLYRYNTSRKTMRHISILRMMEAMRFTVDTMIRQMRWRGSVGVLGFRMSGRVMKVR